MNFWDQLKLIKSTKHVHTTWYLNTYPDVAALGMDPAEHYLRYGAYLGRNPGKNFDTKFYTSKYPECLITDLNPLAYYWLHGRTKGHITRPPKRKNSLVQSLSRNLFSFGFTAEPLRDLEDLAKHGQDAADRAKAARELALWHLREKSVEGYEKSLSLIKRAQEDSGHLKLSRQLAILEVVCLYQLGRNRDALEAMQAALIRGHGSPDLRLASANFAENESEKINAINLALALHDISPISLTEDEGVPIYDRLTSVATLKPITNGPKISVLLAAYEAQGTLGTALRSLQEQTWKNFEVIVLDDCSPTGGTRAVTQEYAKDDARIKYIRMDQNGGAYIARNRGLDIATGDLITIHDADDWSHPSKLEIQARFLLECPTILGCTSEQARCSDELIFTKIRGGGSFTVFNTSSFMWKANPVKDALGYWDTVRFGADNEFIRRMCRVFGKESFIKLGTGPLSFQREADTSITGDPVKGIDIGGYYGVRKEYLLAQEHFHRKAEVNFKYENNADRRPFPVPDMMNAPGRDVLIRHFDLIVHGDFRIGSPDVQPVLELLASRQRGDRVALVESAYYRPFSSNMEWDERVRDMAEALGSVILVYGDRVTCREVVHVGARGRQNGQRFKPDITCIPEDISRRLMEGGS